MVASLRCDGEEESALFVPFNRNRVITETDWGDRRPASEEDFAPNRLISGLLNA